MNNVLEVLSFVTSLIGMISGVIGVLKATNVLSKTKEVIVRQQANDRGTQALLRHQLYDIYFKCEDKGCRSQFDSEDFTNLYTQYHNLGQNGVMDKTKDDFYNLRGG